MHLEATELAGGGDASLATGDITCAWDGCGVIQAEAVAMGASGTWEHT